MVLIFAVYKFVNELIVQLSKSIEINTVKLMFAMEGGSLLGRLSAVTQAGGMPWAAEHCILVCSEVHLLVFGLFMLICCISCVE